MRYRYALITIISAASAAGVIYASPSVLSFDEPQDPVTLKASTGPVKYRPQSPGGMEIPFQDMEVWTLLKRKNI
jgi:hypothetical protein